LIRAANAFDAAICGTPRNLFFLAVVEGLYSRGLAVVGGLFSFLLLANRTDQKTPRFAAFLGCPEKTAPLGRWPDFYQDARGANFNVTLP